MTPRQRRVAVTVGTVAAAWLVPWSGVLSRSLPATAEVHHWDLAWSGLDLAEAAAAGTGAWLLARGDRRAAPVAGAFAALLWADAWFDVCTAAPGRARTVAVTQALVLELPMAAAAAWLAARLSRSPAGSEGERPPAQEKMARGR